MTREPAASFRNRRIWAAALLAASGAIACSKDNAVDASTTECGDNTLDCIPCTAGEHRCDGAVLKVCQADGQGFDAVMTCETEALCVKGLSARKCEPPACNAAGTKCDGAWMIVCSEGRDKVELTECPSAASCNAGLQSGRCAAGECAIASDCAGIDTECRKRSCVAGVCGWENLPANTVCETNRKCDGSGQCVGECNVASECAGVDTECRKRTCTDGVCGWQDLPEGTACETGRKCDGAGTCVGECNVASDCAGVDTDCRKRTCETGVCGLKDLSPGVITSDQVEGDCKRRICDGNGGVTTEPLPADVPVDANDCTIGTCNGSEPKVSWAPPGTVCNDTGVCDASGNCGSCIPGSSTCKGNAVLTCQLNGQWDLGTTCVSSACVAGTCSGVCAPGAKQCGSSNQVLVCDASGEWPSAGQTCQDSACVGGQCTGSCTPGSKKCAAGNQVVTCDAAGSWPATGSPCTNSACVNGACAGTCTPGAKLCGSGNQLLTCDASGAWPSTGDACVNSACVGSACVGVCAPGTKQCSGKVVQTCDSSGAWQSTETCGTDFVCAWGACAPIPSCVGTSQKYCSSALVPAGVFPMGRGTTGTDAFSSSDTSDQPEHQVHVSAFRLETYEVTTARFAKFVQAYPGSKPVAGAGVNPNVPGTGWNSAWDAQLPADKATLEANLKSCDVHSWYGVPGGNVPINCVTWYEAVAFCAWDGGWLPTEAEWEKAAAGGDENRLYPWGQTTPGYSSDYCVWDTCQNYPSDCDEGGYEPVGSMPSCTSRWGHLDLAGNVSEWVYDWYSSDWYTTVGSSCSNCANLITSSQRVHRGGSFADPAGWGGQIANILRAAARDAVAPTHRSDSRGFRCARPAP